MADEANGDDELLLTEEVAQPSNDQDTDLQHEGDLDGDGEDEEVLTFGDEAPPEAKPETSLVKHLRDEIRRRNEELAKLRNGKPEPAPVEVGPKPTLWADDIAGDEDKYDERMDAWRKAQEAVRAQSEQSTKAQETEREAWQNELRRVDQEKAAIKAADTDDSFATVRAVLSLEQQAALVQATDKGNTARIIYALGKHPDKLAELAEQTITDTRSLAAFIKSVTKLEAQLKVVKRRATAEPERIERGSASVATNRPDKKLEKLEKEAARTNDRTELLRYRKQLQTKR